MKLIFSHSEYYLLDDYNISEPYDSRIKKGMPFFKDEIQDTVIAEYSPASKVSRPVLASTEKNLDVPLLDRKKIEMLLGKTDIEKMAEKILEDTTVIFERNPMTDYNRGKLNGIIEGYNKCLQNNFTLEQISGFAEWLSVNQWRDGITKTLYIKSDWKKLFNIYMKSISKTEWDIEVEIDTRKQVTGNDKGFLVDNVNFNKPFVKDNFVNILNIK